MTEIAAAREEAMDSVRGYSSPWHRRYSEVMDRRLMGLLPGGRRLHVLDFGCGVGVLLGRLEANHQAVGADISIESLRLVHHFAQRYGQLVAADAERPPFASESFDVIIYKGTLHHVQDTSRALAEAYRMLRPGGIVILDEPCTDSRVVALLRSRFSRRRERSFAVREIRNMLADAGLQETAFLRHAYASYAFSYGFRGALSRWRPNRQTLSATLRLLLLIDALVKGQRDFLPCGPLRSTVVR